MYVDGDIYITSRGRFIVQHNCSSLSIDYSIKEIIILILITHNNWIEYLYNVNDLE